MPVLPSVLTPEQNKHGGLLSSWALLLENTIKHGGAVAEKRESPQTLQHEWEWAKKKVAIVGSQCFPVKSASLNYPLLHTHIYRLISQ